MMWIMSSEEFINECVTNKNGKNKGKRSIWLMETELIKRQVLGRVLQKQFEKYIATDFLSSTKR